MPWRADNVSQDLSLGLARCRLAMGLDGRYRRRRVESAESGLAAEAHERTQQVVGALPPRPPARASAAESSMEHT